MRSFVIVIIDGKFKLLEKELKRGDTKREQIIVFTSVRLIMVVA
jgi:hypothetical protein